VKYLITSGNAKTGRATLEGLKALGEKDIVVGARDPAKSEAELKAAGASHVVELDLDKPDTIAKALVGVERVFIVAATNSAEQNIARTKSVTELATKPGSTVKVLSRLSGASQDENSPFPLPKSHGVAARILKESGLVWFSVGPNFFFENWLQQANAVKSGTVYGAAGEGKVGYIAVSDIGAAAAAALTNPDKFNGKHIPISGPASVTDTEVTAAISAAIGKPVKYVNLTPDQFKKGLLDHHLPPPLAEMLTSLEGLKASGHVGAVGDFKGVVGRDPIDVKTWAEQHKNAFL